jgi:hypothetical protein
MRANGGQLGEQWTCGRESDMTGGHEGSSGDAWERQYMTTSKRE